MLSGSALDMKCEGAFGAGNASVGEVSHAHFLLGQYPMANQGFPCHALRIKEFNAQGMANTAWAFATAGRSDAQLFDRLAQEAAARIKEFLAQEAPARIKEFKAQGMV